MGTANTALVAFAMVASLVSVGQGGDIKLQTVEPIEQAPIVSTLTMPTTIERMALASEILEFEDLEVEESVSEPLVATALVSTAPTSPNSYVARTVDKSKLSSEVIVLAKTVYGEARGCSATEQAAVVWCILNRVDSNLHYMPDDIISVVTQRGQFAGYSKKHPVKDEIVSIVLDVLERWQAEKNGATNVGRVLPKQYLYFHGDGKANHFRDSYRGGNRWNWSLTSPYSQKIV
jgi:hypothetical protein